MCHGTGARQNKESARMRTHARARAGARWPRAGDHGSLGGKRDLLAAVRETSTPLIGGVRARVCV